MRISHIFSSCAKLTKILQNRHDNVAGGVHWDLPGKCGFEQMRTGMTMFLQVCLKMKI